ncbi:DUF2169 domain-containing protein [Sorangium sp. So ce1014]|uniref:DUF2169 family type VI secretion system accessory protein n=1 Tax=Sorangium sp. So ce1014 TaxID=3133326 RepID=UPI003F5F6E96
MNVQNATQGMSFAFPSKDKAGRDQLACVLKYTFAVGPTGRVELLGEGAAEVDLVDTYNGEDPAKSSIRRPSQLFDQKPGTDVVLIGSAYPPRRGNATHVDVSLRFGPVRKTVRAHGVRAWMPSTFGGLSPGPARPIREPIPLIYELAWGGMDLTDPERPAGEPRNYVGRGVACDPESLVGQPAAQLEDPAHPLGGRNNTPASFGAIHRHWQPRASYAGTHDQAWIETRMPLLPEDFDPRFHVCVPHDQWSPTPLRGDEPCEIHGATPEGAWRFELPRLVPGFSSSIEGRVQDHRTHLDTVLIDAGAQRVELTWRAAVPLPRKYEMLERVRLIEKTMLR